eukprot:comp21082_c0_seq1/m.28414 comp21082_c0_seq1/g.28414  ORF comp21082_c0_seq1/g.28414 comp21082_c0_seq1/m.28414 type:complete len:247 (-) comp21082_c0_seq1:431-1171(-)
MGLKVQYGLLGLFSAAWGLPIPNDHVSLVQPQGMALFVDPKTIRESYFKLSTHLETQMFESYCGVATSVTVLNAFGSNIRAPVDPLFSPFPYFTQQNIFSNECALNVTTPPRVQFRGMTLDQVASLMSCWGVDAEAVRATDDMTLEEFRNSLVNVLLRPDAFVTVNFDRKKLNEEGGGHHSPLGAYHPGTDRFLMLDVARFKYPPHWVTAQQLFDSVKTGEGDDRRGFIVAALPDTTTRIKRWLMN